jgi:hypothetical protein
MFPEKDDEKTTRTIILWFGYVREFYLRADLAPLCIPEGLDVTIVCGEGGPYVSGTLEYDGSLYRLTGWKGMSFQRDKVFLSGRHSLELGVLDYLVCCLGKLNFQVTIRSDDGTLQWNPVLDQFQIPTEMNNWNYSDREHPTIPLGLKERLMAAMIVALQERTAMVSNPSRNVVE